MTSWNPEQPQTDITKQPLRHRGVHETPPADQGQAAAKAYDEAATRLLAEVPVGGIKNLRVLEQADLTLEEKEFAEAKLAKMEGAIGQADFEDGVDRQVARHNIQSSKSASRQERIRTIGTVLRAAGAVALISVLTAGAAMISVERGSSEPARIPARASQPDKDVEGNPRLLGSEGNLITVYNGRGGVGTTEVRPVVGLEPNQKAMVDYEGPKRFAQP